MANNTSYTSFCNTLKSHATVAFTQAGAQVSQFCAPIAVGCVFPSSKDRQACGSHDAMEAETAKLHNFYHWLCRACRSLPGRS